MSDIIAAISTALAPSGVGIIRLSGWGCGRLADEVLRPLGKKPLSQQDTRKMVLTDLLDRQGRVIDRILAVYTRGPGSYTGEDTVELQCHGSPAVLTEAMAHLLEKGARQAGPGEFTKRAFLNGNMDLTAAEAVIDLIEAETADAAVNASGQVAGALQKRLDPVYETLISVMSHFHAVLDYPDEDIDEFSLLGYADTLLTQKQELQRLLDTAKRGSVVKNGVKAVILGRPNAGKSSLLNALAGYDRAIVTDIPGTTRDTVEEKIKLGRILLRLHDTAGIRDTEDVVEKIGVERAVAAAEDADLALVVIDASSPMTEEDRRALEASGSAGHAILILNKTDLPSVIRAEDFPGYRVISLSAKEGTGMEALSAVVEELFYGDSPVDGTLLTNLRHTTALTTAREAMEEAISAMEMGQTPDAVLVFVEEALSAIGDVTGKTMREDITADIFSRFCVGK